MMSVSTIEHLCMNIRRVAKKPCILHSYFGEEFALSSAGVHRTNISRADLQQPAKAQPGVAAVGVWGLAGNTLSQWHTACKNIYSSRNPAHILICVSQSPRLFLSHHRKDSKSFQTSPANQKNTLFKNACSFSLSPSLLGKALTALQQTSSIAQNKDYSLPGSQHRRHRPKRQMYFSIDV